MSNRSATVLIVDDSEIIRRALRRIFESEEDFSVVGEAGTGREAVRLASTLAPQLIMMDLGMPDMSGMDAIEEIMARCPTRILVLTGDDQFMGMDASFEALSRGALDLLRKAALGGPGQPGRENLLSVARSAVSVPVVPHFRASRVGRKSARLSREQVGRIASSEGGVVAIGASTGGPAALHAILAGLPPSFPLPILIAQHMDANFVSGFVHWLDQNSELEVRLAREGEQPAPGCVYLPPEERHLTIGKTGALRLVRDERAGNCPSVDVLFESVAHYRPRSSVALLMTGMGSDGAKGLLAVRSAGGRTLCQDEESSVVYGMPRAAMQLEAVERQIALVDASSTLCELLGISPGHGRASS